MLFFPLQNLGNYIYIKEKAFMHHSPCEKIQFTCDCRQHHFILAISLSNAAQVVLRRVPQNEKLKEIKSTFSQVSAQPPHLPSARPSNFFPSFWSQTFKQHIREKRSPFKPISEIILFLNTAVHLNCAQIQFTCDCLVYYFLYQFLPRLSRGSD